MRSSARGIALRRRRRNRRRADGRPHRRHEGVKFEPETLTVKRAETVMWINKDPFPHTVTAPGVFDSHGIPPNRSWKYTAHKAGDYAYTCMLHPNMKGALKVE